MHLLLFEPATQGHHLIYLRCLVEDLLGAGHKVSLALDNRAAAQPLIQARLGHVLASCSIVPIFNQAGRPKFPSKLNAIAATLSESGADSVFLPCFDEIASQLCRRAAFGLMPPAVLKGRIRGIFIRPRVIDGRIKGGFSTWLKRVGFARLYRQGWIDRLFLLDETLTSALRAGFDPGSFPTLPDPWYGDFKLDRAAARQTLDLPLDRFIFLHYGTSSRRKGLHLVARAAATLGSEKNFLFVCAGKCAGDADSQADLQLLQSQGRATLFNHHINDAEEKLLLAATDAVVLAYVGHYGSSAILSRAAAANRWVIASDEGLVGHRVRTHNLGLTFKSGDADALREALSSAIALPPDAAAAFSPGLAFFAAQHSRESFRTALLAQFPASAQALPLKS
jgi:glycosyltransferase involved in cell wall biosynthesis